VSDYFNLHEKLVSMQQRGISIDGELCNDETSNSDSLVSDHIIVMNKGMARYMYFTNAFSLTWYIELTLNFQLVKV
jgi:hypothetical protein